jgi:hypothetical protein
MLDFFTSFLSYGFVLPLDFSPTLVDNLIRLLELQIVPLLRWTVFIATSLLVTLTVIRTLKPQFIFIWHCFLRPIGVVDQRTRLDKVIRL